MIELPGGILTFISVYLMGLGLNLTPCVYPMMTVTVSLFGNQKEQNHLAAFIKASVYVLGIAMMCSALGVTAALTGAVLGSILQNKWVLIGIAIILFVLALSMLGLYTLQAPSWLLTKLSGRKAHNLLGIFISGLFVGVFAIPCVGPPVIALLTFVGTRGDPLFGFFIFFILSLGLGTPYLIFGTFSGLLQRLPKSGIWLVWIEHAIGVTLISIAFFYLALALNPDWIPALIPLTLLIGGAFLGFLDKTGQTSPQFVSLKRMLGLIVMLAAFAVVLMTPKKGVVWESFTADIFTRAEQENKPMILDFYADWCIPCHELDQFTYTDKRVIQALENFMRIKVDLTDPEDEATLNLIDRFDIPGVPVIIFLSPKGREIDETRVTGFISAEDLLKIIQLPQVQESINEKLESK